MHRLGVLRQPIVLEFHHATFNEALDKTRERLSAVCFEALEPEVLNGLDIGIEWQE